MESRHTARTHTKPRLAISLLVTLVFLLACMTLGEVRQSSKSNEIDQAVRLLASNVAVTVYKFGLEDNKIIVMNFTDLQRKFTYLGTYVAERLSEELSTIDNMKLINRADLELILGEMSVQVSGIVSEREVLQIGNLSGANVLITGTITDLGSDIDITAQVTLIETSEMRPSSIRMAKSQNNMALISAISRVEEQKERDLNELIENLEAEIQSKKDQLDKLLRQGAEDVKQRIAADEEKKRRELDLYYKDRMLEVEATIRKEEAIKRGQLASIEQQLREKSSILSALRAKEQELARYESEIGRIQARIARQNNAIENYITNGMTTAEVAKILGLSRVDITINYQGPWYENFKSGTISFHGDYVIRWSDASGDPVVIGFCNRLTGKCYYRSAGR